MGNWDVPLPPDYLNVPPDFNMAHAACARWVEEGRADDTAILYGKEKITFGELEARSLRMAGALEELGITRGKAYILRSGNRPEYVISVLAGMKIGAVPVLTSALLGPRELRQVIENADAVAVFTIRDRLDAVLDVRRDCPTLKNVILFDGEGDGTVAFDSLSSAGPVGPPGLPATSEDVAYMLYTSGTTGRPKGIVHAHRWLVGTGDPIGKLAMKATPEDRVWSPADFSFGFGLGHGLFYPLYCGAAIYIHPERFDPTEAVRIVSEMRITIFATVPTAYRMILARTPVGDRFDLGALRVCMSSGETLPPETYRTWKERFGCDILDGIGVSELQKFCCNLYGEPIKPGSAGKAFPGIVVELHGDEGGPVPDGEPGRIAVRGDHPAMFLEYREMPETFAESFVDGFYYTGDIARFDGDGYLWYLSRQDDLIKSRGYLVSPKEVEETCMEHPGVLEAGVIGVPDAELGQRIKAFVVLKPGGEPGREVAREIRETLLGRIAPFKVPKMIEFLPELPKTANGKIRRNQLRAEAETGTMGEFTYAF